MTFPARFTLVAAANPCPCGFRGDPVRACRLPRRPACALPAEALRSAARPDRPAAAGPAPHEARAARRRAAASPPRWCGRAWSTARDRQLRPVRGTRGHVQRRTCRGRSRGGMPTLTRGGASDLLGDAVDRHGADGAWVRSGDQGRAHDRRPRREPPAVRRRARRRGALLPERVRARRRVGACRLRAHATSRRRVPAGIRPRAREKPTRVLLLRCLLGITPRALHAADLAEGSASSAPVGRSPPATRAPTTTARSCAIADVGRGRGVGRRAGARFAAARRPGVLARVPPARGSAGRRLPAGPAPGLGHRRVAVVGFATPVAPRGRGRRAISARGSPRRGWSSSAVVRSGSTPARTRRARRRRADGRGARLRDRRATTRRRNRELLRADRAARHARQRVSARRAGRAVPVPCAEPADRRRSSIGRRDRRGRGDAAARGSRPTTPSSSGSMCSRCPAPVTSPLAETPLELIRDGARLIRGADRPP